MVKKEGKTEKEKSAMFFYTFLHMIVIRKKKKRSFFRVNLTPALPTPRTASGKTFPTPQTCLLNWIKVLDR
jgi:hypothetical protein